MRVIKYICLACFLIFGTIMQAEIYQNQLWDFSTAYFLSSRCETTHVNFSETLSEIAEIAKEKNVLVFTQINRIDTKMHSTVCVYGNKESIRKEIKKIANVEEKRYVSLISGISDVEFHEYSELTDEELRGDIFLSYIGNEGDIFSLYEGLNKDYQLETPEYWNATERDMMFVVWGLIVILMIVMNVIEAVRSKKEVVVRSSLGENVGTIVCVSVIRDIMADIVLFVAVKGLMSKIVSGAYEERLIILIYTAGILLSVATFLSFFFFDVREAFANAESHKGSLCLLGLLKFIAGAATIFTLSTNLNSLSGNFTGASSILKPYFSSNYFMIATQNLSSEKETEFWDEVYTQEDVLNPIICLNVFEDKKDVIFINSKAYDMLQWLKESDEETGGDLGDIWIFVPCGKHCEDYKKIGLETLDFVIKKADIGKLDVRFIEYKSNEPFFFFDTASVDGINKTRTPIVIYQKNDKIPINGSALVNYKGGAIIYSCDAITLRKLCESNLCSDGKVDVVITNVYERYQYSHTFLKKLFGFISSLCVVVMLLNIAIMISVSKLEFRQNSMKISLMKVLGYSFWERHKRLLLLVATENSMITIGMMIYVLLCTSINPFLLLIICIIMTAAELTIIFTQIIRIEHTGVVKTLKGGCL